MDFNNEIVNFSEDTLNKLFEETPTGTPNANVLEGASQDKVPVVKFENDSDIPTIDLDKLDEPEVIKDEAKVEKVDKKEDDLKEEVIVEETTEQKVFLKNNVDFLVAQGIWKDFDGREDLTEIDSETYAKLVAAQDSERLKDRFDELVDSTGDYGKAIISHIKNGGNPEEVIDLFKEQKDLESFDISTEQGKLDYIYTYYSEILGMKEDKIKTFITNTILKSENKEEALASELDEVKDKFKDYYKSQLDTINKRQDEINKNNQEKQKLFVSNIKEALTKDTFTDSEKKIIEKSITEFKHKLPNGMLVNDFYVKFAEKQKDPSEYVKLVHFILDREGYEKKVAQKKDTKATEKKWDFIKGNANVNKKISTPNTNQVEDKESKLDFSSIFKK